MACKDLTIPLILNTITNFTPLVTKPELTNPGTAGAIRLGAAASLSRVMLAAVSVVTTCGGTTRTSAKLAAVPSGSFHREDGCLVTINYVYQCDNHG
jgi:hypothetical protein